MGVFSVPKIFVAKNRYIFPKKGPGRGGQRPFGTFPKNHRYWYRRASLSPMPHCHSVTTVPPNYLNIINAIQSNLHIARNRCKKIPYATNQCKNFLIDFLTRFAAQVMDQYASVVTPSCPPVCSCHFYHFAERPGQNDFTFVNFLLL